MPHSSAFGEHRDVLQRLFSHTGSLLGLDISSSRVSVAQLCRHGRSWALKAWAVEELPPGAALSAGMESNEVIAAAVHTAWRRCGSPSRRVAAAVPGRLLTIGSCRVPAALDAREQEVQALLEVDKCIPYAAEEASLDYRVLGRCPQDAQQLRLLLAICPAWYPRALERCVSRAGLQLAAVDGEPWAAARCCSTHPLSQGRSLLVVAREGLLSCALFEEAILHSCQELPLPGEETGAGALHSDSDHAPVPDPSIPPAPAPASGTGRGLWESMRWGALSRVLLLGSLEEEARACLEESCGAPVTPVAIPAPVAPPDAPRKEEEPGAAASVLGVACGLALRGL